MTLCSAAVGEILNYLCMQSVSMCIYLSFAYNCHCYCVIFFLFIPNYVFTTRDESREIYTVITMPTTCRTSTKRLIYMKLFMLIFMLLLYHFIVVVIVFVHVWLCTQNMDTVSNSKQNNTHGGKVSIYINCFIFKNSYFLYYNLVISLTYVIWKDLCDDHT